ncbi:hypothetical protein D3C87_2021040 [compost metagenome]
MPATGLAEFSFQHPGIVVVVFALAEPDSPVKTEISVETRLPIEIELYRSVALPDVIAFAFQCFSQ